MSGKSKKSNKAKLDAGPSAGEDSNPHQQTVSPKPARQKKPSSHLESSAMALSQGRFDPIIVRNGEIAYSFYFDSDNGRYAIGGVATKTRKDLLGSKKRVPDDQYVCRSLSQYLQTRGIRDVSYSTIYDWMRANETREQLGGKDKAPKISISFYVAVSRHEIPMEKRRKYLEQAIKDQLTVKELKDHINGVGQGGAASGDTEAVGPFTDIATMERAISTAQSLLLGTINVALGNTPDNISHTIARLENLSIIVWQIKDDLAKGRSQEGVE